MRNRVEKLTVLLIDDDEKLGETLAKYFDKFSLTLLPANRPSKGMELLKSNEVDLILLDGMLPEKDGLEVCREIRSESDIPIIMLTGRAEQEDKILGLDYGADDYVTKPFEPRELVARINSLIRRSKKMAKSGHNGQKLEMDKLVLDPGNFTAHYNDENLNLTTQEFEVLYFLMESAGKTLTRESIMQGIHGEDWKAFDRALDIAVSRIRKKLKKLDHEKEFIKTVWGKGYMFLKD